jgi:hypothetical protein
MPVQRHASAVASGAASASAPAAVGEDPFSMHLLGPLAPVQRMRTTGEHGLEDGGAVQAAAAAGATGSGALPHFDAVQRAFGDHDLSGVRSTVGGTASTACDQIGAESYAQGNTVAFKQEPNVWLAAHEAAHVVQQRSGASIPGGVGREGDGYEAHADRVADTVAAGGSAVQLLGTAATGGTEGAQVQRYVAQTWNGQAGKAADDGSALVVKKRTLYAESSLVATSNATLKTVGKNGSHIKLVENTGDTITQNGKTLNAVEPAWVKHAAGDGNHGDATTVNEGGADSEGETTGEMALWTDCGKSSGAVTGSQLNGDRSAVYNSGGSEKTSKGFDDPSQKYHTAPHSFSNQIYFELMPGFMADAKNLKFLTSGVHYTESAGTKTMVTIAGALQAKELYAQMSADGRDAFDKAAGTNHYANPEIGESYTMATEANMPGFKETGKKTWNFHWAGVIMKAGSDNITLENFAVTAAYAKSKGVAQSAFIDRDWNFDMYGTQNQSQTFHQEHLDSNTHGNMATSMAVRTDK